MIPNGKSLRQTRFACLLLVCALSVRAELHSGQPANTCDSVLSTDPKCLIPGYLAIRLQWGTRLCRKYKPVIQRKDLHRKGVSFLILTYPVSWEAQINNVLQDAFLRGKCGLSPSQ